MEFDVVEGEKVTTALVNSVSFVTRSKMNIFVMRCVLLILIQVIAFKKKKTVHREQRRQM